jgi:hypothetical protein
MRMVTVPGTGFRDGACCEGSSDIRYQGFVVSGAVGGSRIQGCSSAPRSRTASIRKAPIYEPEFQLRCHPFSYCDCILLYAICIDRLC